MIPFTDTAKINALINHPSIREHTLLGYSGNVDLSPQIQSGEALFFGDEGGGFLMHNKGQGVWEAHTQFLPETDKRGIMTLIGEVKRHMFCKTDCILMTTFVEYSNKPALFLALRARFRKNQEIEMFGKKGDLLTFTVKDWARSLCQH